MYLIESDAQPIVAQALQLIWQDNPIQVGTNIAPHFPRQITAPPNHARPIVQ